MILHVGVMWHAIYDCDLFHVDVMSEHGGMMRHAIFDCDLRLQYLQRAIFNCNLRLRYFLRTRLIRMLSLSDSLANACARGRDSFVCGRDDSDVGLFLSDA